MQDFATIHGHDPSRLPSSWAKTAVRSRWKATVAPRDPRRAWGGEKKTWKTREKSGHIMEYGILNAFDGHVEVSLDWFSGNILTGNHGFSLWQIGGSWILSLKPIHQKWWEKPVKRMIGWYMMGFEWTCYNMFMIVHGFLEGCWGLNGMGSRFSWIS